MRVTTEDVRPPDTVLEIVHTLRRAGYDAWCVGGAVRDALMGIAHLDWDLATSATPPQVRRLFDRTIPIGIEFGTVGVLDKTGRMHEVTTFRRDVQHDGRHAVVEFGASLDEDLARRDFTINAIAYDPIAREIRDPFGGRDDLVAGRVRAVGNANDRMTEDRLRALRAIRFSARFHFDIEQSTWDAIVASAPFLSRLSPERIKQEIEKTLEQVQRPSVAFRRWRESGAFTALVPSLADVSDPTLEAVDCLPLPGPRTRPQRVVLRLAALFSELDERTAAAALRALRFSNHDIAWVSALVGRWHTYGASLTEALRSEHGADDRDLRRLTAMIGRLRVGAFVRIAAARWRTAPHHTAPTSLRIRSLHRRMLHIAFNAPIEIADLAVDGDDLRRAGVPPGREIGRVLALLLEFVLEDPSRNTRDALLERAIASLDQRPANAPRADVS